MKKNEYALSQKTQLSPQIARMSTNSLHSFFVSDGYEPASFLFPFATLAASRICVNSCGLSFYNHIALRPGGSGLQSRT